MLVWLQAALFYWPVDFTDASDLHQTVVKFIGWSIESDKITLLKIKFNQDNCQQKDTPLTLKQMSRRMIDSPLKVLFYSVHRLKVRCIDAHISAMHRWNQPMNKTTQPNGARCLVHARYTVSVCLQHGVAGMSCFELPCFISFSFARDISARHRNITILARAIEKQ